ncbi:psbP domain-containing protein 3, chloroplastic isoform X1 [Morus notabilis]|uniref:psbP domain-containing protein 3, chloroplastic isoform X1 n=1 Tax=Morus notabilis TaxID=981085 RepID=UPI000CED0671|nr:psbP domain-containing protein 3, chloroplastic isoform X1 [Morus notabilis]
MAMACLSSWCPSSLQRPTTHFTLFSDKGTGKLRQLCGVTCSKNNEQQQQQEEGDKCLGIQEERRGVGAKRRQILVGMTVTFAAFSFKPIISDASADTDIPEGFRIYIDGENKFKILIPEGWRVGVGGGDPNGFKSVTAFYPDQNTSSNAVSVIITGIGPDFTKMESFGKVDEFAETLVSGLDRSWQRPPGVAAKLINSKSKNGFYYIDYTLQNPGESRKYLFTALGMASNGWYNRLYTVTGQYEEGDVDKYSSMIEKAVTSFGFT